jgi:flavin-dependent dehydrogenase
MREPPPLIVGGGPAGAGAALALARAGIRATLVERQAVTGDAICGGFLSWATLARLEALGIPAEALGGHPVREVALFDGRRQWRAALPAPGIGLSRRRLDTVMRGAAAAAGAVIRTGVAITALKEAGACLSDGELIAAPTVFLATGKHDLRGLPRPRRDDDLVELGLRLRLPPDTARQALIGGAIELHLFEGGYLGLLLQEDGSANACLAVTKRRFRAAGGDPARLFAEIAEASPALGARMGGWTPDATIDAIGAVPYGWRTGETRAGLYRLGDQAAVIPSLAGEGIGLAIASGTAAARTWRQEGREGAAGFQRRHARAAGRPLAVAGLAKRIATRPALLRALGPCIGAPGVLRLLAHLTRLGG